MIGESLSSAVINFHFSLFRVHLSSVCTTSELMYDRIAKNISSEHIA